LPEATNSGGPKTWVWVLSGIVALILGGAVYYWLTVAGVQEAEASSTPPAPLVRTAVADALETVEIRQTGFVQPRFAVDVAPEVTGQILTVHDVFELGARVAEGAALISLSRDRFEADLSQADAAVKQGRAAVSQAGATFRRQSELAESDFASEARLDEARVGREQAEAQLALALANRTQAQLALDDTVVTAPYEAIVVAADASVGQILSAGTPVGRLAYAAAVEVSMGLTPSDIGLIGEIESLLGMQVDLYATDEGGAKRAVGTITALDPQIARERARQMSSSKFRIPSRAATRDCG